MPSNLAETKVKSGGFGAVLRTIAPAVPLGVALLHGAIAPNKLVNAKPFISEQVQAPSLADCEKTVPCPVMARGQPAMWWFVFKLNAKSFPGCGGGTRSCPFGGEVQTGPKYSKFGQQY